MLIPGEPNFHTLDIQEKPFYRRVLDIALGMIDAFDHGLGIRRWGCMCSSVFDIHLTSVTVLKIPPTVIMEGDLILFFNMTNTVCASVQFISTLSQCLQLPPLTARFQGTSDDQSAMIAVSHKVPFFSHLPKSKIKLLLIYGVFRLV